MKDLVDRYSAIINGDREPQSREEDLFMYAYESARAQCDLLEVIDSLDDESDLTSDEWAGLVMGYALGQKINQDEDIQIIKTH